MNRGELNSRMADALTILIPTRNRPDFVARLLEYYRVERFRGVVCLLDGSDDQETRQTATAVRRYNGQLRIRHVALPGMSIALSLKHGGETAETEFVAFAGDDDYLIPGTLDACVSALEDDSSASAAHGTGVVALVTDSAVRGSVDAVVSYRQPVLLEPTASERLYSHLTQYSVSLFSVHRRSTWQRMFREVDGLNDTAFAAELLPCCLSAVCGRVLQIERLGLVRQDHARRVSLPNALTWIASPGWPDAFARFCTVVARDVAEQDRISSDSSRQVVEKAFWAYLAKLLRKEWQGLYGLLDDSTFANRAWANAMGQLGRIVRAVRAPAISLSTLRQRRSADFQDFNGVYRSMTDVAHSTHEFRT